MLDVVNQRNVDYCVVVVLLYIMTLDFPVPQCVSFQVFLTFDLSVILTAACEHCLFMNFLLSAWANLDKGGVVAQRNWLTAEVFCLLHRQLQLYTFLLKHSSSKLCSKPRG